MSCGKSGQPRASANATRFYEDRFGLKEQLGAKAYEVQALIYRDGRDGRLIAEHRFDYKGKYGHPYVGIHRADLQAILSGAVGMDSINLNKRLIDIDDSGSEAVLKFADGSSAAADLVIGADGAKSTVRRLLLGYDDAYYSGASAFRGIVEPEQMPSMPDPDAIQFWMGPGRHCLHYPIGNGAHNFFLVERHPSPWPHKAWIAPTNDQEKLAGFGSWHPAIIEMVNAVPVSERWGLFHRPPLGRWSRGRVTLIGDAAHALVPHHGQGANQSIEDAVAWPTSSCPTPTGTPPERSSSGFVGDGRARCSTPPSRPGMSITCPMGRGPTSGMPDWQTPTRSSAIWAGSTPSSPTSRSPTSRAVAPGSDV
jgi:2-polyprenyl-6-methoxyphenol hydroxylase and related FAD-dependent oxidoreductases